MKKDLAKLNRFLETASDQEIGNALLSRLNGSANTAHDFQQQVQKLLHQVLNLVEFAENWAQAEAETRYVNFVREAARQRRETIELTDNNSVQIVTRSKR
jgi:hypothetical protein